MAGFEVNGGISCAEFSPGWGQGWGERPHANGGARIRPKPACFASRAPPSQEDYNCTEFHMLTLFIRLFVWACPSSSMARLLPLTLAHPASIWPACFSRIWSTLCSWRHGAERSPWSRALDKQENQTERRLGS